MQGITQIFDIFRAPQVVDMRQEHIEESRATFRLIGAASTAAVVGSVAFGILGLKLLSGGSIAAVIGTPIVMASAVVGYAGYNGYQISKNFLEVMRNPESYRRQETLRKKVEEGTFMCGWLVDLILDPGVHAH